MTEFAEVKTQDLSGVALDWAVAQVEKVQTTYRYSRELVADHDGGGVKLILSIRPIYSPSAEWRLAGPLIEKNKIGFGPVRDGWVAHPHRPNAPTEWLTAEKPLVAICRAIVADKLGMVVSVPKELLS